MAYLELHARSAFSFLEGAALPEELVSICADHQMPAMALLDRNGFYGSPRFHLAARKVSVRAHVGAEVASPGRLALSLAGRIARRLSEPLPADHADEIAREKG